jgi:hypothetical protein
VRTFGRATPIGYTRGGRTFAGTLVFATLEKDPFSEIYRPDALHESWIDSSTSLLVDQLPPFNLVIVASNELGGIARQIVSGVTLLNYGTTYSIDDIYTETTYTYLATDITPLLSENESLGAKPGPNYKNMSTVLREVYGKRNGSAEEVLMTTPDQHPARSTTEASLEELTGLRESFWSDEIALRFRDRYVPPGRYKFTQ